MIDFKITNNDISIINGSMSLVDKDEKIEQTLRIRLKTLFGEWFLDNEAGVDYYNVIFKDKRYRAIEVETMIKEVILDTEGITNITEYSQDLTKIDNFGVKQIEINFTVITIYGTQLFIQEGV